MHILPKSLSYLCAISLLTPSLLRAADLPDPDGKPADTTKPVKVFIVMGQSNTLEMGAVKGDKDGSLEKAVKEKNLYPFLVDDAGAWTTRKDVRNVSVMQRGDNMNVYRNDWLTISGNKIGIEIGIGQHLGNALDEPVMVLKSSIGNRSLGWDLLPPGSERNLAEFTDRAGVKTTKVTAGYKKYLLSEQLQKSGNHSDSDYVIRTVQSVLQRRKSRAGSALENHMEEVFCQNSVSYSRGAITEARRRPDFIMPNIEKYHDAKFPDCLLTMLASKATCKDRWRQILTEAQKIHLKHLLTLEPSISQNQTSEMYEHNVQLVLPHALHQTYSEKPQIHLMTIKDFLELAKSKQSKTT